MKNLSTKRPTLLFKKVVHKKSIRLLLLFKYDDKIISKVRNLKLFFWSKTLRGWHCVFDVAHIKLIYETLKPHVLFEYDDSLKEKMVVSAPRSPRIISEENKAVIRKFILYLKGRDMQRVRLKLILL